MRRIRLVAATAVLVLAGCTAAGPTAGWDALETCEGGTAWTDVDGFPAVELVAAGLDPECAATFFTPGIDPYIAIRDASVTEAELTALGAALEESGYTLLDDSFDADAAELAGSLVYGRDADIPSLRTVVYLVSHAVGSGAFATVVEYESPLTRELSPNGPAPEPTSTPAG